MRLEKTVTTTAEKAQAWAALSAVDQWPRWISNYQSIELIDPAPLAVGSRARVKQRGLRAGTWEITELVPGAVFTWQNSQPGVHTVARHEVGAEADGRTRIVLTLEQTGPLAGIVGSLLRGKITRYVDEEAAGHVAAAEDRAGS
ncbi:MAG TPA: SRPBCC family protein [Jatrophihabitantaceae bacterium]|jgi:uncharacterized protein YndB with AHSA1/START domain